MTTMFEKLIDKVLSRNRISGAIAGSEPRLMTGCTVDGQLRLGEGVKLYRCFIQGSVSIGRYTSIWGPNTDIIAHLNPVSIGSFCSIARNVSMQEANHRIDGPSTYNVLRNVFGESVEKDMCSKGPIIVGNDVWVGAHAVILSGVNIGHGAVVGANSVVVHDVPPYAIVAGSPAKVVKMRFGEEVVRALCDTKWWDWPIEKIFENKNFFENPATNVDHQERLG